MKRCVLLAALFLAGATSPAFAAEYWVSQDPTTKECTIVETMPDGSTQVMVGASSYPNRPDAKAAKKAAVEAGVCIKPDKKKSD